MDHAPLTSTIAEKGMEGEGLSAPAGLSRTTTLIFAFAAGLSVANIYAAQPLLGSIATEFGIRPASVGIVMTVTQIGYAIGLMLLVPLGDLLDRRRLIVGQTLFSGIALMAVATAPGEGVLFAAMAMVGLLAVVVQVLVAFAASLALPQARGKAVGTVTSGIVIGILLARFVSGLLADMGGWRVVYIVSAGLTLATAAVLYRVLPAGGAPAAAIGYRTLLGSIPRLFREEPLLRVRAVLALLIFAVFSTFWTALVLPLSAPPHALSHAQVGLFGLAGLAGALAASGAGGLADRGRGQWVTGLALLLLAASWGPIALLPSSLPALILGVVLLDLAVQAVHVTNQSLIFALRPEAHSRLVAGYMVFYSIGSALGAIASTAAYAAAGWSGVCMLGSALSVLALVFWAATLKVR